MTSLDITGACCTNTSVFHLFQKIKHTNWPHRHELLRLFDLFVASNASQKNLRYRCHPQSFVQNNSSNFARFGNESGSVPVKELVLQGRLGVLYWGILILMD
mmetsp:Transcript_41709/g.49967  ORF Transcript_41709/g.49967 Transcript_41709/m.49967 type:complete len:102 (+) Transcript_41709:30-335(+)